MSGNGHQNIEISLEDVIDITDGDNDLVIEGDSNDTVNIDASEWKLGEHDVEGENGESYDVYNGEGGASLTIDTDITINIEE
ncbi:MAG: hypothetical protein CO055_05380 [Sulfurimonas sp. CG_4_9_14_0_2_um_filter_36_407]|nr:MAG: hypothetical protein CO055_05380 [Sulfurimonas sp. CG_4_9_14_0_2_um_filter_36_407]